MEPIFLLQVPVLLSGGFVVHFGVIGGGEIKDLGVATGVH